MSYVMPAIVPNWYWNPQYPAFPYVPPAPPHCPHCGSCPGCGRRWNTTTITWSNKTVTA